MTRTVYSDDNGGPDIDPAYVDNRHALQVAIRDCRDLTARQKFVGMTITTFMDKAGRGATPSARKLAEITGYGVNTITGLAQAMHDVCLLKIEKRGGKRGIVYDTALSHEDVIAVYCRKQKNAYTVTQTKPVVSPLRGDTTGLVCVTV